MRNLLFKLLPVSWRTNILRGVDSFGNRYFEQSKQTLPGRPPRRWVVPRKEENLLNDIPVEWQSWLKHLRAVAPTIQELEANEKTRILLQSRVAQLEQVSPPTLFKVVEEKKEEVVVVVAAVSKGGGVPLSQDPQGQGDSFAPGAWQGNSTSRTPDKN